MMSSTDGTKNKKTATAQNYVTTCRDGAIAANVFKRTAPGGFEYLDFSLSRAWKTPAGKEGYSQNFFPRNREALHAVVDQACDFIEDGQTIDTQTVDTQSDNPGASATTRAP